MNLIKESSVKPKIKLGFVESNEHKKKREIKAELKEKDKFKDVKSRLYDFIQQDKLNKPVSTEDLELQKIQQKGNFKALPLKRSILDRTHSLAPPSERSRAPTEFKEFKLRTN